MSLSISDINVITMVAFAPKAVGKMMRQYGFFDSTGDAPPVTVVIPAFNEGQYIGESVRSASNTGYKGNVDVIVIDNNSTDNTAEIARDAGARVYVERKHGVSAARNRGLKLAGSDIVIFMDAEPEMPKGAIDRAVESAKNGYAAGSFAKYSGNPVDDLFNGYTNAVNSVLMPLRNFMPKLPSSGSGTLMYVKKSEAMRYNVLFDEGENSREDSDFLTEMARHGFVDFISDVTVKTSARRSEGKSVTNIMFEKAKSYLKPSGKYAHVEGKGRMAA